MILALSRELLNHINHQGRVNKYEWNECKQTLAIEFYNYFRQ